MMELIEKENDIKRTLILENQEDYRSRIYRFRKYSRSHTKLQHRDNKDKTYVWYEKSIDLTGLEKGTYTLQVYTKTTDAEDYGEITDAFGTFKPREIKIGEKTYQNKNQ